MSFGKRAANVASADPHGRRKVFGDEFWQGESGQALRTLGMSPDDEANLVPNVASLNAKLQAGHNALTARVAARNLELAARGGGAVRPFSLIPDPCWTGDMGHLLMMRLELLPFEGWNAVLLPADEASALMMNLPYHPGCDVPAFVEVTRRFLADADARLRAAHAEASATHDFARFAAVRDDVRDRVQRLANFFLTQLNEAWSKNRPTAH